MKTIKRMAREIQRLELEFDTGIRPAVDDITLKGDWRVYGELYLAQARAVAEALRNPSDAVLAYIHEHADLVNYPDTDTIDTMITAILEEKD